MESGNPVLHQESCPYIAVCVSFLHAKSVSHKRCEESRVVDRQQKDDSAWVAKFDEEKCRNQ